MRTRGAPPPSCAPRPAPPVLRFLAGLVWAAGDLAGLVCRVCYRAAGRLNGWAYEIERSGPS